jgi:hypothetical protein
VASEQLRIGQVAQRAGVSTRALRYYEEQGLLEPERTPSGQRVFPASAVARVLTPARWATCPMRSCSLATVHPSRPTTNRPST